jgi:hypothetical protein
MIRMFLLALALALALLGSFLDAGGNADPDGVTATSDAGNSADPNG